MDNLRRTIQRPARRWVWCGATVVAALLSAGCHALPKSTADPLADANSAPATQNASAAPAPEPAMVLVEFHSEGSKPERGVVTLKGDMYVQDVLQHANAFRKFSRAKIELIRRTPAGHAHKMDVSYDRKASKVDPQTDYHVQPGDKVIVTQDPSNVVTDMLQGIGLPMNGPAMSYFTSG